MKFIYLTIIITLFSISGSATTNNKNPARLSLEEALIQAEDNPDIAHAVAVYFDSISDTTRAFSYYKSAADTGHPLAIHDLGHFYLEGEIVGKDAREALRLFNLSARKNCPEAMITLAITLGNLGRTEESMIWRCRAAIQTYSAKCSLIAKKDLYSILQDEISTQIFAITSTYSIVVPGLHIDFELDHEQKIAIPAIISNDILPPIAE